MTAVLLDTHTWAWSLTGDMRLSTKATTLITEADSVFVSPISFFEIGQKVPIGKWPEMEPFINDLPSLLAEQGGRVAALVPEVCLKGQPSPGSIVTHSTDCWRRPRSLLESH